VEEQEEPSLDVDATSRYCPWVYRFQQFSCCMTPSKNEYEGFLNINVNNLNVDKL
jgi:hypothetical protein